MEITKEQVLDIYGTTGNYYLHRKLKAWFPEAFKVNLEVGNWYCHEKSTSIVNYQGGSTGYGFNVVNSWCSIRNFINWTFETHAKEWRLATTEEWESALIEEAKKRGYKNGNYECLAVPNKTYKNIETDVFYIYEKCVWFGSVGSGNKVFREGVWAEIIKTFNKEEAEKLLGGKII
jgi:hypothetical protein